jgi:hypothetical protein
VEQLHEALVKHRHRCQQSNATIVEERQRRAELMTLEDSISQTYTYTSAVLMPRPLRPCYLDMKKEWLKRTEHAAIEPTFRTSLCNVAKQPLRPCRS